MSISFSTLGSTAIITGASSGLGAEFARQLAPEAACLVLAARSLEPMEKLAAELRARRTDLRVIVVQADLSTDEGRETLWSSLDAQGVRSNLLINNAGLGDYGHFTEAGEPRIRQQIDVNITALTLLSQQFLARVQTTAEAPAAILNVSSLASTVPMPDLAVYGATKAYVSSLSEALAVELASRHIRVVAVCPGPTPTNFGTNALRADGKDIDRSGQDLLVVSPERVVAIGLKALQGGSPSVFPGKRVALAGFIFRVMPRFLQRFLLAARFRRGEK